MSEDKDDVIVPQQAQVNMHLNADGDVVIKRDADEFERQEYHLGDDDIYIVIPRRYIPAAIERLKTLLAEGG